MKSKNKLNNDRSIPSDRNSLELNHHNSRESPSHSARRSSKRIKNMKSVTSSSKHGLVDSAYDADEESITPNSSPDQQKELCKDPYDPSEIDMIEGETQAKTKQRRKNDAKKTNRQRLPIRKLGKAEKSSLASMKNMPTSTPVLHSSGGAASKLKCESGNSLPVTPEVTPILPYKPHECASPKDDSFTTPQIHRPTRKRSLLPESLTSLSTQLSYSSHGDSGIALSPVFKKHRAATDTQKHISELDSKTTKSQKSLMSNKIKDFPSDFNCNPVNKKQVFSPISQMHVPKLHRTEQMKKKQKTGDDSCFGFDSLESPLIASENSPPVKRKQLKSLKKGKKMVSSKDVYRLVHTNSSDSSLTCITNEPVVSLDSEGSHEDAPIVKSASPTLFSDSFSADSESLEMEVNRSIHKSYKPSKVRRMKENATVSKLDVWASNFNMEIEDIEKFDLNIE